MSVSNTLPDVTVFPFCIPELPAVAKLARSFGNSRKAETPGEFRYGRVAAFNADAALRCLAAVTEPLKKLTATFFHLTNFSICQNIGIIADPTAG